MSVDSSIMGAFLAYQSRTTVGDDTFPYTVDVKGGETVQAAGSIYSKGGTSDAGTKSVTVAKALDELLIKGNAVCYGNGKRSVAERHIIDKNTGEEQIEIASYTKTGTVCAGIIEDGGIKQLTIGFGQRFGTVIMEAIIPFLAEDGEFHEIFQEFAEDAQAKKPDNFNRLIAILSDNVYFRLKNDDFKLNLKAKNKMCSVPMIKQASIESGLYTAEDGDSIYAGRLTVASYLNQYQIGGTKQKKKKGIKPTDFRGIYEIDKTRSLNDREKSLVPEIPNYIVIPEEAEKVCKMVSKTTNTNRPVRNILLTGPAGTGKTLISQVIASGLNRPRVKMTGNVGMEMIDLTGTFVPATGTTSTSDLPTIEDIEFDLADSYKRLTGKKMPKGVTENEVIQLLVDKQSEAGNGKDFVYVPSPLVQALKYGWVCECQEFNMLANAGVLTGLNSILEGGTIELPTGEVVRRHPEAVIIFTMNTNYEGCRPLNQSVLDRFPIKLDINMPNDNEMVERISKVCECNNIVFIKNALNLYTATVKYLADQGYNGVLGIRVLYDWVIASLVEEDMQEAAEYTLLTSAMPSLIEDSEKEELKDFIRTNIIAPNVMPIA